MLSGGCQPVCLTAGVTGMGGTWREKSPDAESAAGARIPESVGKAPHLSGARGVRRFLLRKTRRLKKCAYH